MRAIDDPVALAEGAALFRRALARRAASASAPAAAVPLGAVGAVPQACRMPGAPAPSRVAAVPVREEALARHA